MHYLLFILVCTISVRHLTCLEVEKQDDEETTSSASVPSPRAVAALSKYYNTVCSGTSQYSQSTEGVCLGRLECQREGGTNIGSCGVLGVCCAVEQSCLSSSALKLSYFVGPSDTVTTMCNFEVKLENQAVCQVRLDFETFHLAAPTKAIVSTAEQYSCTIDSFSVTSPYSANLGFKYLCGQNNGQHIYIPTNSTTALDYLILNMHIGSKTSKVSWRIKVTQLECETQSQNSLSLLPSSILANLHQTLYKHRLVTNNDLDMIAPPGCLQYFTASTGTFESFNYHGTSGIYLSDLNYAICFKRYPDTCQISYTFEHFVMDYVEDLHSFTNTDCVSSNTYWDYLYIPSVADNDEGVRYCGKQSGSLVSKSPGTLQVQFHSGSYRSTQTQGDYLSGFKIRYETKSC